MVFVIPGIASRSLAAVCMCVALVATGGNPARAQTPAGANIANTATCTYSTPAGPQSSQSNTVSTNILPVYSLVLTPGGSIASPAFTLAAASGDTVVARFHVANAGNASDSVVVAPSVVGPPGASALQLISFLDANGDGRVDPGETTPSFLALASGASTPLDVAVVVAPSSPAGDLFVQVAAHSAADTTAPAQMSVVRVQVTRPPAVLHLGPAGNARALPGGDGSADDVSTRVLSTGANQVAFDNDVFNELPFAESVELVLPDSLVLPPGVNVVFADTSGVLLSPPPGPGGPARSVRANLGVVGGGQTRRFRVLVLGVGKPLAAALGGAFDLPVLARSASDTTRWNATIDRIAPRTSSRGGAAIAIEQAFREPVVATGDVATLVVTVRNISDSMRIDSVVVSESADPMLDFRASENFRWSGRAVVWNAGSLAGGESRTAVIKYVANSRVARGRARARGTAFGRDPAGGRVQGQPVESLVRIENDIFDSEGFILGDVFVDTDNNGRRNEGDRGVAGAVVVLESGELARTDSTGLFSIPRVFAGYRVVRLDESSLPDDLTAADPRFGKSDSGRDGEGDNRHATKRGANDDARTDPRNWQRIVHLLPGGHARVEFPLHKKPEPVVAVHRTVRGQEKVTISRRARLYSAFVLPSSHFALGRARLSAGIGREMAPILSFLDDHPDWRVYLEGHTDSIPMHNAEFTSNQELSEARARAVGDFLSARGIAPERIVAHGWADRHPVASNNTIEGRRLNRRVEISFIPPHVKVSGDGDDPLKVSATVRDLTTLPDTFRVRIAWEFTTSSEHATPMNMHVYAPPSVHAHIAVRLARQPIVPTDTGFPVERFVRGNPVHVEVTWTGEAADTSRAGDVRVVLAWKDHPSGIDGPITLRPFMAGNSRGAPRQFDVIDWTEQEPAREFVRDRAPHATMPHATTPHISEHAPRRLFDAARETSFDTVRESTRESSLRRSPGDAQSRPPDTAPDLLTIRNPSTRGREHDAGHAGVRAGLIEPIDGTVFGSRNAVTVRARAPIGARSILGVNGVPVPDDRIGMRSVDPASGFEVITWFGVDLVPAWNTVTFSGTRVDGSAFADTVHIARSSAPRRVVAARQRVSVPADGVTRTRVRFDVLDAFALPVADGTAVTLAEGSDIVEATDARPGQNGIQVLTYAGRIEMRTRPSRTTGTHRITAECADSRASVDVAYVPPGRPVLATGIVDLGAGVYNTSGDGSAWGVEHFVDGVDANARARAFVQGTTRSGINVTARIDTRKRDDDPLLKQISPDKQYPVFGDASEVTYAAPARGGTYIALERDESYMRYGDFRTAFTRGEFLAYERATTGLSTELVRGSDRFGAFVAGSDFSSRRDEIRADGTSGFYYLRRRPIVENSEKIIVETRDRFRSEKVIDVHPMVRNRDYTINWMDGSILFKEAVAAYDARFNPRTIVVIYEARTGVSHATLLGVRGERAQPGRYRVAAQAVTSDGDGQRYTLYGADGEVRAHGWRAGVEAAQSDDPITGNGSAWKLQGGYDGDDGHLMLYHRRVDGAFNNPSFRGSSNELATRKSGYEGEVRVSPSLHVRSEGYAHRLYGTRELRETALGELLWRHGRVSTALGMRGARRDAPTDSATAVLALAGVRVGDPSRGGVSVNVEKNTRRAWVDEYPDRIRTRASMALTRNLSAVVSHEYLTASGRAGSHQLTAGLEARPGRATDVWTKYSMNRLAGDVRTSAVTGVRHHLRLGPHTSATFGVEGLLSLAGRDDEQYMSVRGGLGTRVPGSHFVDAQYELRTQRARTRNMVKFDAAWQARRAGALISTNVVSVASVPAGRNEFEYRGVLAATYRPLDGVLHALAMVRNDYARFTPSDPDAIHWRLIASTDANIRTGVQHEWRLRYAYKHVEDYSYGMSTTTNSDLVLGQYIHNFARDWDADVWARWVNQRGGGSAHLGTGIEVGRTFAGSLRVAAGFTVAGAEDPDFAGTAAWSRGFGVRAQLILSEWLLRGLKGDR